MGPSPVQPYPRAESSSTTDEFLNLISDPFQTEIQSDAFLASLYTSLGVTAVVGLAFCFLRPLNQVVYAPRLKHADQQHAPPPIGKGPFAWVTPVVKTKEQMVIEKAGLDAALFLRFTKMCRNIFLVLTVFGCGILIPTYLVEGSKTYNLWSNIADFMKITPQFMWGNVFWALVACAWLFDIIICGFLWWNYRAVVRLRRHYFNSPEYQQSLHARTLMVTQIPPDLRTDEGILKITDEIMTAGEVPRTAIARNVKELPDLIEQHESAVRKLEKYLAKYLKHPDKLPAKRPMCKPSKKDKTRTLKEKVDAIDYYTERIQELENEIKLVRESVDKRNAMPYGFASYANIEDAHIVAYAAKKKHPQGTDIRLAPKPNDIIWKNLPITNKARRWKKLVNDFWIAVLTLVWIAPNILIAVFLATLSNLGKVWPAFQAEMDANPKTFAAIQGILSPAITTLFYYFLPQIFRALSMDGGDVTKTSRERHVTAKLYSFFVFNNLIIFSIFAAIWKYVATVVNARKNENKDLIAALEEGDFFTHIMLALVEFTPFWISWLLQRNLGAAIDLSQLLQLTWGSISRRFLSPTPRELIELTAPRPFEYASYYNYFLFYTTVTLCFGFLQPLVIPVTAFYFTMDSYMKKYLLMYVFVTKNESGGQFWRLLFNRMIFAMILSNFTVALLVKARGYSWNMLIAMIPLPFLLMGFKWYCMKTFDDQTHYYTRGITKDMEAVPRVDKESRRKDRVGVRFGHPAFYKKLMTPMVHAKAQHRLAEVYRGRLDIDVDTPTVGGYSDTYQMKRMSQGQAGKKDTSAAPFEIVAEGELNYDNFRDRPEFASEYEGSIYGHDISRTGTPGSFMPGHDRGRSSSRDSSHTRLGSEPGGDEGTGTTYPAGYHSTPGALQRPFSPARGISPAGSDRQRILESAAPMGSSSTTTFGGYARAPLETPGSDDDTSYDYFRKGGR